MCTTRNNVFHREVLRETSSLRPTLEEHADLNFDFSIEEVTAAIKLLEAKQAPDPDGIHNESYTHFRDNIVGWLSQTELLN